MTPDEKAADVLLDHEAERQDDEARAKVEARPEFKRRARMAIAMVTEPNPPAAVVADAAEWVARGVLLELAERVARLRSMVVRQTREKRAAFDARSGKRIRLAKITKAQVEKRIEERREV